MKKIFVLLTLCLCTISIEAQTQFNEKPKLVVGIVVDQMRWDYLGRYYDRFTADGFRRMIDQGYSCNNCLINYIPTITAIGHTSVYTGSTPALHGICGNTFYIDGRKTYCTGDTTVQVIGSNNKKCRQSPVNLLATTIGDQLRLHNDFLSKVIGISYKDRAAILPAGRSGNAAYWIDTKNLCFVTSSYYMKQLPEWAKKQNERMAKDKAVQEVGSRIGYSPICGTVTTDMAIAALEGEQLGKGQYTDMLCVSYSQTDVIGHEWSTRGERTDAAYLTLDKDLARLFKKLDEQVGQGQWIAFLTADHGAAHNYQFMQDHKLNGGKVEEKTLNELHNIVKKTFGVEQQLISGIPDYRVYLDHKAISDNGIDMEKLKTVIIDYLRSLPHMQYVFDIEKAATTPMPPLIRDRALLGYHPHRGGDIIFIPEPNHYNFGNGSSAVGTTHGEWNPYDAHIPLLFYGWKVPHGATSREVHITDIAPTICQMLHIQQPNACIGEAITEITK